MTINEAQKSERVIRRRLRVLAVMEATVIALFMVWMIVLIIEV